MKFILLFVMNMMILVFMLNCNKFINVVKRERMRCKLSCWFVIRLLESWNISWLDCMKLLIGW